MDEITFTAKYKDWVAVKKIGIEEKTKEAEVVHMLASVSETADRKAFEFSGVKTAPIDDFVGKLTQGKRKSYNNLAEILSSLSSSELSAALSQSGEELKPLAEAYFMKALLGALGLDARVSTGALQKMYPDLKFPKPRGRFGKKKSHTHA